MSMEETQTLIESPPRFDADLTHFTGINIGGHTVTACTEHLDDDARSQVRWLHWYARNNKWTWDDLVRNVGYSSTTWSRIWNDKYRYAKGEKNAGERMPIDTQVQAIKRYRTIVEERDAVQDSGFVETSIWDRISWLCRRVFIRQSMGFIYGESQIGKTICLKEYTRRNNHGQTVFVEMPPTSGVQCMLKSIAEALNVPIETCFDKLLRDVLMALDSSKLLIVDEVHKVFTTYQKGSVMRCFDTLRYLHDRSRCGMVLCGTNVLQEQLLRGPYAQFLKQLKRRAAGFRLQLPLTPPREDLDKMAKAFGLGPASGEAEKVLIEVAEMDGFGPVKKLLQDSSELARKKKRDVTWDDFVLAHTITEKMGALVK